MNDRPPLAILVSVTDPTVKVLAAAVARLHGLLEEGKRPGTSPEADAALAALRDLIEDRLELDPSGTWYERDGG